MLHGFDETVEIIKEELEVVFDEVWRCDRSREALASAAYVLSHQEYFNQRKQQEQQQQEALLSNVGYRAWCIHVVFLSKCAIRLFLFYCFLFFIRMMKITLRHLQMETTKWKTKRKRKRKRKLTSKMIRGRSSRLVSRSCSSNMSL